MQNTRETSTEKWTYQALKIPSMNLIHETLKPVEW